MLASGNGGRYKYQAGARRAILGGLVVFATLVIFNGGLKDSRLAGSARLVSITPLPETR